MRKKSLICKIKDALSSGKICPWLAMAFGAMLFASCTNDPLDGEAFGSDVRNETLLSPSSDDIMIAASPDGTQTKITWSVVPGAIGYKCSAYNVTNPDAPVVIGDYDGKLVDGCSVVLPRSEDNNYKFSIQTIGNADYNNKDAETATEVSFNSFTATYMTIPNGSDIGEWFEQNPIPEDKVGEMLCFDLEPGGEYTLNKSVNFFNHLVTLRATNKLNHAKITINGESSFITARGFNLKYLDIDCTGGTKALIQLSTELDPEIKDLVGTKGAYFIEDPIAIRSCNIENLGTSLISSNKIYYIVRNFIVDDCVVKLNKVDDSNAIINFNSGGYASNYTISNSTIWDCGTNGGYFFSQYSGRPKDIIGDDTEKQAMVIMNSTLYNVSKNKKFSNQKAKGQKHNEYVVKNSIIVDTGTNQFIPGMVEQKSENPKAEYINNTYWWNGADASLNNTGDGCDNSPTAITDDPAFADAANGNFTVNGAGQISKRTGDPRWLPTVE